MMIRHGLAFAMLGLAATGLSPASGAAVSPVAERIVPHRALYALSLEATAPGSTITDARGGMSVEWVEECEGWSSSQRLQLRLYDLANPTLEIDSRFASWESRDGLDYQFSLQNYRNETLDKELRGRATLEGIGKPGKAVYTAPQGLEFDLSAGTVFPFRHLIDVIEGAKAGDKLVRRIVFDGSSEDGPYEINAVIGAERQLGPEDPELPEEAAGPYWPIRFAFFNLTAETMTPFYEMSARLLDTGVAVDFVLDYGEWVVRADLERLEVAPKPEC